jgi:UDP-GlcNAc:undecaprenyl-phosphate/decaprenyl-phosphate GlcNAc-1-phosphate transferase
VLRGSSIVEIFCMASAMLTALACHSAPALARITQLIDRPDGVRKLHGSDTPLVGGPALLIPALLVAALYLAATSGPNALLVAVAAATLMLFIGVADDRMGISPARRLAMFTLVIFAVFAAAPGYVLHSLWFALFAAGFSIPLGLIAVPMTALVILGFINAVNMADGINGQLLGSIVIWCGFIVYFLGPAEGMPFIALACSAAVTFVFNLRGRLFSGSSGAYSSALFVALGAIFAYHKAGGLMPADMILCWFWLPVIDCLRLMVSRAIQGRSPFSSDRDHIHHILLRRMSPRQVLAVYLALLAIPGLVSMADRMLGSFAFVLCILCYGALVMPRQAGALRSAGALPRPGVWSRGDAIIKAAPLRIDP